MSVLTTTNITLIYFIIAAIGIFPFFLVLIAQLMGNWLGCNINEGGTDPCIRFGLKLGRILNGIMVMGWLVLLTGPFALMAGVAFTIFLLWWN